MQRQERECLCVTVAPLRGENEEECEKEREEKVEYEGMFHLNFQLAVSVFRLY